jgi:hypothetical protein
MRSMRRQVVLLLGLLCVAWAGSAPALDHVALKRGGKAVTLAGRVLVTAEDGGLLVLTRDGVLWQVLPQELVKQTKDETPFEPLSQDELAEKILAGLPQGFRVYSTKHHYLIFYNTSRGYAEWCGSLFEGLYRAFTNFWTRKGFKLAEPEFPLVAIVFADQRSYAEHSRAEIGDGAKSMIGYFNLLTDRMTMYDLTGTASGGRAPARGSMAAEINRVLSQPDAERVVATIVHEATHQIAFNCGLHTRLSDCPLWFSEGIAIYFETPDLASARGWRNVGSVNQARLAQFLDYAKRRPADSLSTLLGDDKRFRDPKQALASYAEAWALTYYLINKHPKLYVSYLSLLSQKKPLIWDDAATRLKEFQGIFGEDLQRLDADFVRYMMRVR